MDRFVAAITIASGVLALVVGYALGYRSGRVAGELQAMKSHRHESSRHRGRSSREREAREESV